VIAAFPGKNRPRATRCGCDNSVKITERPARTIRTDNIAVYIEFRVQGAEQWNVHPENGNPFQANRLSVGGCWRWKLERWRAGKATLCEITT
jgi:hypothetical protein